MVNDFWKCVWRELWRRKSRTIIHVISYILAISVMLVLISLLNFSRRAADEVLATTGTHFIVFSVEKQPCCPVNMSSECSEGFVAMGVSSKLIPAVYVENVKSLPSVKDASPFLLFRFKDDKDNHLFTIGGFDPGRAVSIGSTSCAPNDLVSGRFIAARDRLVVMLEMDYANSRGLKTKDTLNINGTDFKIIGIVAPGVRPAKADIYMNIKDAESVINKRLSSPIHYTEDINIIVVEVKSSTVQDEAIQEVKKIDPQLTVSSFACYRPAAKVIGINEKGMWITILIIALGLIVFSAQFQFSSVMERQHDIGILKAIGWSNKIVVTQILAESILKSIIGGILGCILTFLIIIFVPLKGFSGLQTGGALTISPLMVAILLGLSVVSGIIAGAFPAIRVSCQNPAETLRRL
ncbi:MAG: FtsX-like permease family protein [Candidatus Omnitrophica bacterium]|nr:FtsX-like permease family protein [Candidatus Omnitrophota bacterium]